MTAVVLRRAERERWRGPRRESEGINGGSGEEWRACTPSDRAAAAAVYKLRRTEAELGRGDGRTEGGREGDGRTERACALQEMWSEWPAGGRRRRHGGGSRFGMCGRGRRPLSLFFGPRDDRSLSSPLPSPTLAVSRWPSSFSPSLPRLRGPSIWTIVRARRSRLHTMLRTFTISLPDLVRECPPEPRMPTPDLVLPRGRWGEQKEEGK